MATVKISRRLGSGQNSKRWRHRAQSFIPSALFQGEDLNASAGSCGPVSNSMGHVLLVQNQLIELRVMARMLCIFGYRVTFIKQSIKAFALFEQKHLNGFDCVVSDLDMPGISGFQLAVHFKMHNPHIPIILTTARCQAEVVEHMHCSVVDRWLFKPFRIHDFGDSLQSLGLPGFDLEGEPLDQIQ